MGRALRKGFFCFSLFSLFLMLAATAWGQKNTGSIIGSVKDPSGALVPNATVVVKNNANGSTREVVTNDTGEFAVTNLEPGVYSVSVEASGFKKVVLAAVTLETNARVPVDVTFSDIDTGGDTIVNVDTESAPLVESETSVRGDIITGREVTDLPIPQRNFTLLAGLSPGVTRPNSTSVGVLGGGGGFVNGGSSSTESTRFRESGGSVISANGARVTQNNFSLDGVDNNESQFGQIAVYPNPDAIAEFKIETSVPSAESGRAAGAIISTTFKSGGNDFAGTIFENYQGRFLSAGAAQFDENGTNSGNNPNYVTHNYGGTIGGPIFLPRPGYNNKDPYIYDGRNRTFFFFSLAGQRNGTPAFGGGEFPFVTVPTARMRAGDFSEWLNPSVMATYTLAGGGTVVAPEGTIFDQFGNPIAGNNLVNCLACGPFSTFGSNLLNAYPLPTEAGLQNNYRRNRAERSNVDSWDLKFDHRITDNNSMFVRYSTSKNSRIRDNNFPDSPNGSILPSGFGAGDEFGNSRGLTLGDTHVFSPTVINDLRLGWTKVEIGINNPGINGSLGIDPNVTATLGGNNINVCGTCEGIILLGIVDRNDLSQEFVGDGGPFYFLSNNYNFADTVTVVKGNSILKFGADLRNRRNSNFDGGRNGGIKGQYQYGMSTYQIPDPNNPGQFISRGGFASGNYNGIGPSDSGNAVANFLLGYQPGFVGRGSPGGPYTIQNAELAFFVQDDWKVSSDLTLNLGLRYDIFTAPTERYDRQSNFDPATGNIVVAGESAPNGRDLAKNDLNNFGPRLGFAYSGLLDNNKLVVRGGYGIVYTTDVSGVQPLTTNPGTGAANFNCTPITNIGGCPGNYPTGSYPFEQGIPFAPGTEVSAAPGSIFAAPTGGALIYNDPNRKDAYVHQYNLTLQYEFMPNWLAEIAYVGSQTKNLLIVRNIGNANDQGGPGSRQVTNIGTVSASEYTATAKYDSMQAKLEKRFTKGLSILSTYTFSKAIDDNPGGFCFGGTGARTCGPDDPLRPELDRGRSDLDVPHRFTFGSVYDLPIGRGRSYLSDMPAALDAVIGGWQFNNIITIQSGPAYSVSWRGGRPDLVGDPTPTADMLANGIYLNVAAFSAPSQQVFASDTNCFSSGAPNGNCPMIGTLGRNTFTGERQEYWDASIFKNFRIPAISEAFNVQLRIQLYNVLNHVNRSTPNGNIEDGNFGKDFSEQRRRQTEFGLKIIF
ncbi:MAG: TonB-dependent receptor [Pyrinomonadaceae bacterium]